MILNNQNFQEEVLESKLPVLVDFFSTWCPPCQMLAPIIEKLSQEMEGKIKIGKFNIEESVELTQKYNIGSVPTLIFFKNGEEIKRLRGPQSKENLQQEIDSIL
ncbi:MAG: thioredoxin [Patescibacteria group bacterium]|nr:thioredoxin [Patescibacteria group bacterium]MDD5164104.1 thioredoxin [Patescibacteria group bacterium]MDD5534238.1 thioredoxin [Patescibacteria group bacterium]